MATLRELLKKALPEITAVVVLVLVLVGQRFMPESAKILAIVQAPLVAEAVEVASVPVPEAKPVTHVVMPSFVKGVYINAGTAMNAKRRAPVMKMLKETELNSVVIDIKDDFGRIAYPAKDPELASHLSTLIQMNDIDALIAELHEANIYVIARLFVFQDRALVAARPDLAVQSTLGGVWKDYKGVSWIEAASEDAWKYNASIARDAYARGFDEVQLDYIRFPSDGNMKMVKYSFFDPKKESRTDVMVRFFKYMDENLRQKGIPLSADLFGFAYWDRDSDMTIGQRIRDAAPYFTAMSPMAYPSHYPPGTLGFKNPADHPYEIILETLKRGTNVMKEWPEVKYGSRPWVQAFDIGAVYDKTKLRAQMKAVVDGGGTGWLMWNARNVYTVGAFEPKTLNIENN
jgi:hypothetical protein